MKKILLIALLWMGVSAVQAQAPLEVEKFQLNVRAGFSTYGIPLSLGVDYGVYENITVGADLGYRSAPLFSVVGISANGNYHFGNMLNIPTNFDVYAGLNVGYNKVLVSSVSDFSALGLGLQLGGRYFFDDKWAVGLELGGGLAATGVQIGVTYKL